MATYRLQAAYLPQGWARDILVTVSEGMITEIETSAPGEPQSAKPQPPISEDGDAALGEIGLERAERRDKDRGVIGRAQQIWVAK